MDDMERYGDYNEVDESPTKKKNPIIIAFKISIFLVAVLVIGVIGFRIFASNYFPSELKGVYVDDELIAAYERCGGELDAVTQYIRFPYDDEVEGNVFCEEIIIIREMGRIQLNLRMNASATLNFAKRYGVDEIKDGEGLLSFQLFRNNLAVSDPEAEVSDVQKSASGDYTFYKRDSVGTLVSIEEETAFMYRYFRVVFDGVDLDGVNDDDIAKWLSLAVYVNGYGDGAPYSRILVYENHADGARQFEKYTIDKGDIEK